MEKVSNPVQESNVGVKIENIKQESSKEPNLNNEKNTKNVFLYNLSKFLKIY